MPESEHLITCIPFSLSLATWNKDFILEMILGCRAFSHSFWRLVEYQCSKSLKD